jgi:ABC-type glycerol-3-phosphate transport system permease component
MSSGIRPALRVKPAAAARAVILYVLLAGAGILFVAPFGWMLSVAGQDPGGVFAQPFRWIPEQYRWGNFAEATSLLPFWRYAANTLLVTGSVLIGTLLSSSLVAFGFARLRFRGRNVLFSLCLATMMLPGQVTMIPLYLLFSRLGWVDTYLPLIVPSFFGSPFAVFLLRQFFLTIPREYDEAALLDGAGWFRIYWSVALPLSRPALATVALVTFVGTWNDFYGPLIYLNSPELATLTLGLSMLKSQVIGTGSTPWHILMAGAVLVLLPNIAVFFLAQKQFIKGIATGGIRG